MKINHVEIVDTFAEAFPMVGCRLIVTAVDTHWVNVAAQVVTGYATSVIGCDSEAGIESLLPATETPDGRPGVALLFFAFSREKLEQAVVNRVGQCILTCPTTACYDGLPKGEKQIRVGGNLRYFGDGFQQSKFFDDRRYWRIPTMDGEFVVEDFFTTQRGVAGGNFLILGESQSAALSAAQSAVTAIQQIEGVITPFPGGIVRSGSKVGSKYPRLKASVNEEYCPILRTPGKTALPPNVHAVYEIVLDAIDQQCMEQAMQAGIHAACQPGIVQISAGNYGGNLGPIHLKLWDILSRTDI
ncbi:MAG: formylmethanofuran--tetrahydromethanopterin N-formyltransferase [Zavarzinella sp.]